MTYSETTTALTAIVLSLSLLAAPLAAQVAPRAGAPRTAMEKLMSDVEARYVRQFTRQIEPTDDQFMDLLPLITKFIENRFRNAQRKERALAALESAPDSDIQRLNQEIDQANSQASNFDGIFLKKVDPILTLNQQKKLRQLQNSFWPLLGQIINQAREEVQREQQQRQALKEQRQQRQDSKQNRGSNQPARPALR
jgi:hypothetical protein